MPEQFREQPQPPASEKGPRSFWYEDEEGKKHLVEGTPDASPSADKKERPRSFWYTDSQGEKKKVEGARSWWYKGEEKADPEKGK